MDSPQKSSQLIVNKLVTIICGEGMDALVPYVTEVLEWNRSLSLVSRKDPIAACERLLLESIELGRVLHVEACHRVADVGSGAGFPGLVWGLLYPGLTLVLIERREKRALFLERTSRRLGLRHVSVLARDLGDVSEQTGHAGAFDLVVSVAVGDPGVVGPGVEPLLAPNGRYASTVSRETPPPERVGVTLDREQRVEGEFGCYVVYRRGV